MAYYEKVLQPEEQVKYIGRLHWFIYNHALFFLVLAAACGIFSRRAQGQAASLLLILAGVLLAVAALYFIGSWITRTSTEIVVTDKRIIYKRGIFSRQTLEMNVSKVETVSVGQGVMGRVFDFGTVLIKGIGGSWEPLRLVSTPLALRNAIMVG